ncbi:MAG: hypothetical protein HFJ54_04495 [Clostridia bacterium]|nr:hypothetical protein [Clostridia bacterium]
MKNNKLKISIVAILVIVIIIGIILVCLNKGTTELRSIKSVKELEKRYEYPYGSNLNIGTYILTMPFSVIYSTNNLTPRKYYTNGGIMMDSAGTLESNFSSSISSSDKDYSKTNIQVENVDEADIIKTDGDYIYSISEENVVITNVQDPQNPKISSKILQSEGIPEDLIIYDKNTLIVILEDTESTRYNYSTIVKIYNIKDKEEPELLKSYKMNQSYYTSRCIDNKLYVISSGYLRQDDDDNVITTYTEDSIEKEIGLENIKYLTDVYTNKQTIISFVDLKDVKKDIKINSYLIDISNSYVSENYIYLLNQEYDSNDVPPISTLFGIKGAIGPFEWMEENSSYGYFTEIYKFKILENGEIEYKTRTKIEGKTINQYSLDEYKGNLRIALYDNKKGSRIVIFDENLNEIGKSGYVAKGETMYSSRFIGEKAYFVTYKTIDPLFVIDLSNEKQPKVLGELKIPGYSTYLHPYDENYLIGIGMETEEFVNRNSSGKVISTTSKIVGMKMALFDVSNVNNPKEISNVVIGDRYTTSAILTNPKALLFSKEKELIAIPVNNYQQEFVTDVVSNDYTSLINAYTKKSSSYVSEGYLVYSINPVDGFKLKGTVTHENTAKQDKYYGRYSYVSKLLRGLYIEDNLYTVSENELKVNELVTMREIGNLKIKEGVNK